MMDTYVKKNNSTLGIVISLLLTAEYMFCVVFAVYGNAHTETERPYYITMAAFFSAGVILAMVSALTCVFYKRHSGAALTLPFIISLGDALITLIFLILNREPSTPLPVYDLLLPSLMIFIGIIGVLLVNYYFISPSFGVKTAAVGGTALYTVLTGWIFTESLLHKPIEDTAMAIGRQTANGVAILVGILVIIQIIASYRPKQPENTVPTPSYPDAPQAPYCPPPSGAIPYDTPSYQDNPYDSDKTIYYPYQ